MVHKQPIMWVVDKSSTISEMWVVWLDKPTEGRALSLTHFGYLNNHVKPRRKKKKKKKTPKKKKQMFNTSKVFVWS